MNGITSMNLAESLVASVIEAHLNADLLKRPHKVRGLEFCDGVVTVELEAEEATQAPVFVPVPALTNEAVRQVLLPTPAQDNEKRKMLTEAQKQAIYEAVKASPTRPASSIAAQIGVSVTTVAGYVTQYRKGLSEAAATTNGNNRMEAEHSAEPAQEQFRGNGSGA